MRENTFTAAALVAAALCLLAIGGAVAVVRLQRGRVATAQSRTMSGCVAAAQSQTMSPPEAFRRALEAEFAGQYQLGERYGWWVATFPAKCTEVGDVNVEADDEGVIVWVGSFTHVHYNPLYTRHGSLEKTVTECVAFLHDLFSDRVLLWRTRKGDGRLRVLKAGARASAKKGATFLWSGPLA